MKEFISYGQLVKRMQELRKKIDHLVDLTYRKPDRQTMDEIETELRDVLVDLATLEEKIRNTHEFEEELNGGDV